ncbi:MAG TPA: prephenate dehydrogenase/arogenate dehydrogenase family protein [bacterium]|nr:prephenate dehydrogenase/arogenate dehydrogenase family protein [bacterium]
MRQIAIVGLGLIGGSLGLRLRALGLARVIGVDADEDVARRAAEREAADEVTEDLRRIGEAEIVFVAVPLEGTVAVAREAAARARRGAILTDVASVKAPIVSALAHLPRVRYVGGHPMFGTAGRGIAEADGDLPADQPYVLTPTKETDGAATQTLLELIQQLGMRAVLLSPEAHDRAAAEASHLPYLIALALSAAAGVDAREIAGPAFRDATRVAQSPPDLWTEILKANRTHVLAALDAFGASLTRTRDALAQGHYQQVVRER